MNIGSDLSFFSLIMGASLPVQLVMIILIFASIISWKFIYLKIKFLKRSEETINQNLATGEVEIKIQEIEVLSSSRSILNNDRTDLVSILIKSG